MIELINRLCYAITADQPVGKEWCISLMNMGVGDLGTDILRSHQKYTRLAFFSQGMIVGKYTGKYYFRVFSFYL